MLVVATWPDLREPVVDPADLRRVRTRRNAALWWVTVGTVAVLGALSSSAAARSLFGFAISSPAAVAAAALAGVLSVAWFEVYKAVSARRGKRVT